MRAQGRLELERHLAGARLFLRGAVRAKCFECTNKYADGKADCSIPSCPLHPWQPYRVKGASSLALPAGGGPEGVDGEEGRAETTGTMSGAIIGAEAAPGGR